MTPNYTYTRLHLTEIMSYSNIVLMSLLSLEIPKALRETNTDLVRVMRKNQPPLLDTKSMLELMHLDGEQPDGLSLAERLLKPDDPRRSLETASIFQIYALSKMISLTQLLMERMTKRSETEGQRTVAQNLIAVAERQINREHAMCETASSLYMGMGRARPEMVDRQLLQAVRIQARVSEMMEAMGGVQIRFVDRPNGSDHGHH